MIEIRQLRHVIALAETGNYKRAAKTLGISQPALTKSIQRVEADLGVALFDRRSKTVVPTQFGEAVIDRARRVTAEYDSIPAEIDLLSGLHRGELVIGVGPLIAETLIADAIVRMVARHPGLRFVVEVDDWRSLTAALHRGDIQLVVAETSEAVGDKSLEVRPLPSEGGSWVARAGHPLAGRPDLTFADLMAYPTVSPKVPRRILAWVEENRQTLSSRSERTDSAIPNVECDDYPLIKRIAASSDCISFCPFSVIRDELAAGGLVALDVRTPIFQTQSGIVTLRDRSLPPAARSLIHELEAIAGTGGGDSKSVALDRLPTILSVP